MTGNVTFTGQSHDLAGTTFIGSNYIGSITYKIPLLSLIIGPPSKGVSTVLHM